MKFLIRENFFKSIPKEIKAYVISKLQGFYEEIERNKYLLKEIPKGFWIKKIAGRDDLFEFRVNNGDRIFFNINRRGDEEESITFLLYSSHDRGVKKAKRTGRAIFKKLNISKEEFAVDGAEAIEKHYMVDYNDVITYEIKNDKFLREVAKDRRYYYYYLNDEQYTCIRKSLPLFVTGSAGSGKSTITLRKLLSLEEEQYIYGIENMAYFTANAYLKDKIEEQYKFFRDDSKGGIVSFYTLKEFYREHLKVDIRRMTGFEKFKEILSFSFPQWKKWGMDAHHIYAEIYGIIKGIMTDSKMDNWSRNLDEPRISLEEYLKFSSKYSVLGEAERKKVYEVALKYDEELKKQGYEDLNDLARRAMGTGKKFDYLIVDEVQDLTEIEIFMLIGLVKDPRNILLAGDIHQMINSSYFSTERIKNLYYTRHITYSLDTLVKNYRSSKAIVELSNKLSEIRSRYIGNLGMEDYRESFILDEGDIHLTRPDISFIERSQQDANTAVVVADDEEKRALYEKLSTRHRIFTVEEVKGLEYENIICWNLTSSYGWAWKDILEGRVKQDQRYRRYFNLFYVGITRARKELIIMESDLKENPIIDIIKKSLALKEEIEKEISVSTKVSTKEEWKEEGKKLYKLEKLEEAQYAFEKAGLPTWIKEREIEGDIENGDYDIAIKKIEEFHLEGKLWHFRKLILDHALSEKNYLEALAKSISLRYSYRDKEIREGIRDSLKSYSPKELSRVMGYLKEIKEYRILGDIYALKNDYENALVYYEKSGNSNMIKSTREKLLKEKYSHIKGLDEVIGALEEVLGNKGIDTFGKDKKAPLHRVIEHRDVKLVKFLLEMGADPNIRNRYGQTILQKMDADRLYHRTRTSLEERKDKVIRKLLVRFGGEGDRYEKDECNERTGQSKDKV